MNAVKDKLIALVGEELEAANAIYPPFRSTHEGYAVLLEEVEEVKEALDFVDFDRGLLWEYIRQDAHDKAMRNAQDIEKQAVHLAAEAIQVAAMARKFQAIGKDMDVPGMEVE